jgi:N-methylhydantoinase B
VLIFCAGGGGVGNALERDPAEVAEDVGNGVVTAARASEEYGVAIDPDTLEVDERATARLRVREAGTVQSGKACQ